jgi:hypothetical protein
VCRVHSLDLEREVAEPLEDREQVRLVEHLDHDRGRPVSGFEARLADVDSRLSLRNVEVKCSLSSPRTTISYIPRCGVLGTVAFDVIETSIAPHRAAVWLTSRVHPG